jgi:hypothetical protein
VLQWPLALAFREQPTRIGRAGPFEIASDRSGPLLRDQTVNSSQRLSVLVLGARASADETPLLQSLMQQAGVEIDEVLVCRATGEDDDDLIRELRRSFPERHKILTVAPTAGRLEQVAAARDLPIAEKVLVVDATTVLPDARTLATLAPMLDFPEVACAGCLLRAATEAMGPISAGYSLTQIDLRGAPAVSFSPIDPAVWRAPSTYPVVANSLSLLVTRRELLRTASAAGSTATRPESDDLLLGMHFIAQGRVNLCTTVVSAFTSARMRPSQATISVPYRVGPDELARIAETTTIVQRVA